MSGETATPLRGWRPRAERHSQLGLLAADVIARARADVDPVASADARTRAADHRAALAIVRGTTLNHIDRMGHPVTTLTDGRTWRIDLPYQTPPITLNSRLHHQAAARIKTDVRDLVRVMSRKVVKIPRLEAIRVELHYQPEHNRTRDTDNLVGLLKPCIDGLRDYPERTYRGKVTPAYTDGVVQDDSPDIVEWNRPRIHIPGPGHKTGRLWLIVVERVAS